MVRLFSTLILLALVLAIAIVSDKPAPRADFTFINRGDVTTLDLTQMSWRQDFRVARLLNEGLTKNDTFSWSFGTLPGVAESWDISPDGRVYTFRLRTDAKWSNGDAVRAGDFIYAWRRMLLPDYGADYTNLFFLIKGGKAFYDRRAAALAAFAKDHAGLPLAERRAAADALWEETKRSFDALVGVRAEGDHVLRIELERPTPYFLDLTSFPSLAPVYPPLLAAYERPDPATGRLDADPSYTRPGVFVSNGPFMLDTWRFKREMRLKANPHWWNRATLAIDTICMPTVDDPNAQVLAFTTGAVDWVSDVTPGYRGEMVAAKRRFYEEHKEQYESLLREGLDQVEIDRRLPPDPRKNIHVFPAFGTYFYNFNCLERLPDGRINPFADARVRRAFALATEKEPITRDIRRTGEAPTGLLVPPGSIAGYASPRGLPYDPEAARRLLAEAGYPGGNGLPEIEILINKDGGHDLIAQAVARAWQRELNVRVRLVVKEIKVVREDLKNARYMVSRGSWFGDYGDPTTFLELSRTGDGNNDRKYSNPRFDALLDRAADEPDAGKRLALLSEAERIIVEEDLPLLPVFHYVEMYLFDANRLSGITSHPRQEQNMYWIDILGDGKGTDTPRRMRGTPPPKGDAGPVSSPSR